MERTMELEKYSIGIGDRFGFEGAAQLRALQQAAVDGVRVVPVWNKSNREHIIIGTTPEDVQKAAGAAVRACSWSDSYYLDADHIGLATVDRFLQPSNFFTIDVADFIGKPTDGDAAAAFMHAMVRYRGSLAIPGLHAALEVTDELLAGFARKYLTAIAEAGSIYRHIEMKKGAGNFIPEVSLDEAQSPQTPSELFLVLAAIAREDVPIQTIAPKFTGSFLKGIDYVGDVEQFSSDFQDNLAVIAFAVGAFNLPRNLKLSMHSGSDKFSLYPVIHRALARADAGIHLKTAGTTWLEEVIGLAASGTAGLELAKEIYHESFDRFDELCKPYLAVVSIDRSRLPSPQQVARWGSEEFVQSLRHDQTCARFNIHFRQLLHVGYKVAAEMGERFTGELQECRAAIEENVTYNIYERHIRPLFLGWDKRRVRRT